MSPPREITDARAMRAMAHPTRLALLEALRREGELTASRAAELLDESPGNMSWHLQTLAKYGFVEETGEGKGRARPWRIVSGRNRFRPRPDDPGAVAATDQLLLVTLQRAEQQLRDWFASRHTHSTAWQEAAFGSSLLVYLTPEELARVAEEFGELLSPYQQRADPAQRPDDALPVRLTAFGHPLPPTVSGR